MLLDFLKSESAEWALFISSFISSTILPGGSEVVLVGTIVANPSNVIVLTLIASLGNTLGGVTSYILGRIFPKKEVHGKAWEWLQAYGSWSLLLSWLPVVGDALVVGAGWMRLNALKCLIALVIGKTARYAFIAWTTLYTIG